MEHTGRTLVFWYRFIIILLHYLRHKPVGLILKYLSVELTLFQYRKLYCLQNVCFLGTYSLLIVTIKRLICFSHPRLIQFY